MTPNVWENYDKAIKVFWKFLYDPKGLTMDWFWINLSYCLKLVESVLELTQWNIIM